MTRESRIFVAGHRGLIGSALLRRLCTDGYTNLLTCPRAALDLEDRRQVEDFFARAAPEYVFMAAGKVGGIEANRTAPADFIRANLAMQTAVLHAACIYGVKRLIFFGSACMYPREGQQPLGEASLLTGPVEPTSEAYALAKLAGVAMCQAYNRQHGTQFLTVIPASVYGPNDHFDLAGSHVLSALIRKFHDAKKRGTAVVVWGTGTSRREFIYADDVAEACLFLMRAFSPREVLNVGVGEDISIKELAALIRRVVGADVDIEFDRSRPDGAPRKLLDSSALWQLGWLPKTSLEEGIRRTYDWYAAEAVPEAADAFPGGRR
jgi:GDP-L-fucose synthase